MAAIPGHVALERDLVRHVRIYEVLLRRGLAKFLAELAGLRGDDVEDPGVALRAAVDRYLARIKPKTLPDFATHSLATMQASVRAANGQVATLGVGRPFKSTRGQQRVAKASAGETELLFDQVTAKLSATLGKELATSIGNLSAADVVERRMSERFRVAESEARTVAATSTARLNSQLVQERNQALGIERYMWVSSRDERVRRRHIELDRTIQKWDEPPVAESNGARYNAGARHRCRCTCSALVDDVLAAFEA